MPHTLINHLTYNLWANERIGHLLMAQDESVIYAEQKSSFASIAKTVFHIWDAEVIWLTRMKGGTLSDWPSKKFTGGKAEMLKGFINSSTEFLQFFKDKGEPFIQQKINYKSMKGDPFESNVEEIIFHVVNHGTYHRGQIITMLHQLGVKQMVSTDLIVWFRERQ
jgi:uncharacterized damage-inducible protein DinB